MSFSVKARMPSNEEILYCGFADALPHHNMVFMNVVRDYNKRMAHYPKVMAGDLTRDRKRLYTGSRDK